MWQTYAGGGTLRKPQYSYGTGGGGGVFETARPLWPTFAIMLTALQGPACTTAVTAAVAAAGRLEKVAAAGVAKPPWRRNHVCRPHSSVIFGLNETRFFFFFGLPSPPTGVVSAASRAS